MEANRQLTSVYVIEDVYKKFKINAIEGNLNLQKFVNRSLDLYNRDEDFRTKINTHEGLATSGSKY
jgi:hypothetical protein